MKRYLESSPNRPPTIVKHLPPLPCCSAFKDFSFSAIQQAYLRWHSSTLAFPEGDAPRAVFSISFKGYFLLPPPLCKFFLARFLVSPFTGLMYPLPFSEYCGGLLALPTRGRTSSGNPKSPPSKKHFPSTQFVQTDNAPDCRWV